MATYWESMTEEEKNLIKKKIRKQNLLIEVIDAEYMAYLNNCTLEEWIREYMES